MSARDPLWPDFGSLALLLAPLPGLESCGPSLRYDAVMAQIRNAREADDPNLPMGEWERPLKRADWPAVQTLCIELLAYRSKDLHAAAWLLDASIRLQQAQGLNTGIRLLSGLVEQHWAQVHPQIADDGDCDARVAPLAWLNEALPLTLQLQLTLLPLPGRRPAQLTLDDWEQLLRTGVAGEQLASTGDDGLPARDELQRLAGQPAGLAHLVALREQLDQSAAQWSRLNALIDERLGRDAPSLGRVAEALARLQRATSQLIAGRDPAVVAPGAAWHRAGESAAMELAATGSLTDSCDHETDDAQGGAPSAPSLDQLRKPVPVPGVALHAQVQDGSASVAMPPGGANTVADPAVRHASDACPPSLNSREAAYQTLQAVADYLQAIEPHSPTPYLVRRAVSWGAMPLPQLMQEMLREEGDLNRLFSVLGLPPPSR